MTDTRVERFRSVYEAGRPRLLAYALRRTASPEDAADVVAETFAVAWRRLDDVPGGDAEVLWLYATARRVLANHHRRTSRRSDLIVRIAAHLHESAAPSAAAEGELVLLARAALDQLADADREVLLLAGWEGLHSAEIAVVLGCSPTAARIRLHRARTRLTALMGQPGPAVKQDAPFGHSTSQDRPWTLTTQEARLQ